MIILHKSTQASSWPDEYLNHNQSSLDHDGAACRFQPNSDDDDDDDDERPPDTPTPFFPSPQAILQDVGQA